MAHLERHVPNINFQQNATNKEPKIILASEEGMKNEAVADGRRPPDVSRLPQLGLKDKQYHRIKNIH